MKILYFSTSFPSPDKGATIYTDLAEELYKRGHEIIVTVAEQKSNHKKTVLNTERGFPVLRVTVGDFYDVNVVKKAISQLMIPSKVYKEVIKRYGDSKFDLILFESPPITSAPLIKKLMKYFKADSYLMLKDIFPQNAVDLNLISSKGPIYKFYKRKERQLYETATFIGCMSEGNLRYIKEREPLFIQQKLELFPNTKTVTQLKSTDSNQIRKEFNIPDDATVFLFGGNMGKPQYIENLCYLIKTFKDDPEVYFMFVGRGTDRVKISETIKNNQITNAQSIENLPRDKYDNIVLASDIGIISLHPEFTIPNFPSRILSYMDFAKPVLAITDTSTDFRELIEHARCGEWVSASDRKGMIVAVKKLKDKNLQKQLGQNGRDYFMENYTVDQSAIILERKKRRS